MPRIEISDLNKLSEEELIAYATLLKSKKARQETPPEDSIGSEIESKISQPGLPGHRRRRKTPIIGRVNQIISYLKTADWLSGNDFRKFDIPIGGSSNKIKAILTNHRKIVTRKIGHSIYYLYRDGRIDQKLSKLQEGYGKKLKKVMPSPLISRYKQLGKFSRKRSRDLSGFFAFKSEKLSEYLSDGMSHKEAFKKVNEEWKKIKKERNRILRKPVDYKEFPEILCINSRYKKILVDMLRHVAEDNGTLEYAQSGYVLGITTTKDWEQVLSDILIKSDTICDVLEIANNFSIEGEGKNKILVYRQ